jgi:hypothetical protein
MSIPTLMLTSPRGMSRIPPVDCQGVASWVQFSKPGNVSKEGTGAGAVENATASGEEVTVGVEEPGGRVDKGCAGISTEDCDTEFV